MPSQDTQFSATRRFGRQGRPTVPNGWIGRDEAAKMLGIHTQSVLAWEKAGKMPHGKKHGNVKIWNREGMERFMATLDVADYARKGAA